MELFFTGKTIEEAMAAAHAQLGEDVTPEIVDLPARRLFKTIPARVRVVVEDEPAPQQEEPTAEGPASQPQQPEVPEEPEEPDEPEEPEEDEPPFDIEPSGMEEAPF